MTPTDLAEMADADPFDLMTAETDTIHRYYAALDDAGWDAPTRCPGWTRRELLAHLAAVEEYTRAGLESRVAELLGRAGGTGLDEVNAWGVRQRAGIPRDELLAGWYGSQLETIGRLRERGLAGTLDTSIGPYPVGRQAFYLATELAIHADDAAVPQERAHAPWRRAWRVRFGRVALDEADRGLVITAGDRGQLVRLGDDEALLSDDDFVEATAARLPPAHPLSEKLRKALVVFS